MVPSIGFDINFIRDSHRYNFIPIGHSGTALINKKGGGMIDVFYQGSIQREYTMCMYVRSA